MPYHLAAFVENVDQTLDNITPLPDDVLATNGDDLIIGDRYTTIFGVWAGSTSAERARIVAASLRAKVLPDIQPINAGPEPTYPDPKFHDLRECPIVVEPSERLNFQVENDGAGAAEDIFGLLFLGSGAPSKASGKWMPVRATTAASAMTANVWNLRSITLAQSLPPGTYELGGVRATSTSLVAVRAVFPGQVERPGALGADGDADQTLEVFRRGNLGVWGTFKHDQLPQFQFLVDAADNEAQQLILDIRKVG